MPLATSTTSAPGLLADVGDLVDERDLRGQERVGGELDHLRALDVGAHERRVERRVEVDDGVARPVAVVADDDAVRVQEVLDRRALLEELGAGDVAEAALALLVEQALDRRARPDGTVDFITSAWRSDGGIASTTAWTAERSASPE
jgi:hypothetical protein